MSSPVHPVTLTPDNQEAVSWLHLPPDAITQGDTREDCLREGGDALAEAMRLPIHKDIDFRPSQAIFSSSSLRFTMIVSEY
jgi:predicted RNase H-like HicB family nuclease